MTTPTTNSPSSTTVSNQPAATPPPTAPATWTEQQAQTEYLAIVAPINESINGAIGPAVNAGYLPTVTAVCTTIAAQEDVLARQLTAGQWPVAAQTRIAALITAATESRTQFQNCAAATTLDDAITALNEPATYGFAAPAEAVRVALGLPGN